MRRPAPAGTDLHALPIQQVDVRAGLFRECEAMAAYAGAAGIVLNDKARGQLGLLDVGIERRNEIVMSELAELHGLLAKAVEPATPRALELMRWDARRSPLLHRLAPVPALRSLLFLALLFLVLFCGISFSGQITRAAVESSLLDLQSGWQLFSLFVFYFSLAGIGATFKSLYDAYQYVKDGRYDPRLDSTYYIRIGLGLISGLLLAQVLNQFVDEAGEGTGLALGKPLLALLGGFAAQLVYRALSRLVEALESIFRPELRDQLRIKDREDRASRQQAEAEQRAMLAGKGAALATAIEATADPARRRELVGELMDSVLPGFKPALARSGVVAGGAEPTAGGVVEGLFRKADRWLTLSRTAADLLPEERSAGAKKLVAEARDALREADEIRRQASSGDAIGAVQRVLGRVVANQNPLVGILQGAFETFGAVLGRGVPGAAAAATPVGLVLSVVGVGVKLGSNAFARWKVRVLEAPYRPDLLPPAAITFNSVLPAIQLCPPFARAFADLLETPDPPTILEIGQLALADEGAALRQCHGDRFTDDQAFEEGLDRFRKAILGGVLVKEIPADSVAKAGVASPEALLEALDAVREDPAARQDLELVALLGERVRNGEVDMADIEEAVREAGAGA
ncbi:MAG: hypothetical protein ACOC3D_07800 [Pseudomonadota bacterium]